MDDILIGWKEISNYLRVSEKTAMRYRKRGLPVKINRSGHPVVQKSIAYRWMLKGS